MLHSPIPLCNRTFFFFIIFILLFPNPTIQTSLFSPVSKDKSTNLFTLSVFLKTPLQPAKLFLDLSFLFPWIICDATYNSTSFRHVTCDAATFCRSLGFGALSCVNCSDFNPPDPNCVPANLVCGSFPENPVTEKASSQAVIIDTLALPNNSDGSTQGKLVSLPNFAFSCAPSTLLKGLPKGVTGLAALGRSNLSVQAQVSSAFTAPPIFAVCFPGSSKSTGVAFFGSSGPYYAFSQSSKVDLAKLFVYTPLVVNPVGVGDTVITYGGNPPSNEYFIGLTSIRINGQRVLINNSLLTIDEKSGFGGTKISTDTPYSILESSIYKMFTELFVREAGSLDFNLTVTNPVNKFSVCYDAGEVKITSTGPMVPTIDLVLDGDDVVWRFLGANSMVRVTNKKRKLDVWCLGFVDGGVNKKTPIVIGGKQLEENLLQFDLKSNKLGFTSLLASRSLSCADFNVTDFANHKN